jgi:chromosome segregation ATPase
LHPQIASLDAERQRQVAEKQESLEMMTRAAATATQQAGVKQEALNHLSTQVATLTEERESLLVELEGTAGRCLSLESHLEVVEAALNATCAEKKEVEGNVMVLVQKVRGNDTVGERIYA